MSATRDDLPACEDDARAAVVDACLRMNALGINHGSAGNVSLRWDRGAGDGLLVTPSALAYERMGIDDIVWLALDADAAADAPAVEGSRRPSSEWRIHRDLYRERPEARAVVHSHPPFATALACSARGQAGGIPAFHYMVAMAGGDDIRCAPYATFGSAELSAAALVALRGRRACLLANHGMLAFGTSLDEALALAVEVETLARMYCQALLLGDPVILDDVQMRAVVARFADYGR